MDIEDIIVFGSIALGLIVGVGGWFHPLVPVVVAWISVAIWAAFVVYLRWNDSDWDVAYGFGAITAAYFSVPYVLVTGLQNASWGAIYRAIYKALPVVT